MLETDSSHTASHDASKSGVEAAAEPVAPTAAVRDVDDLGELARAWARTRASNAPLSVFRFRLVLTLAFALVAAFVMVLTYRDLDFAVSRASPLPVGDLRSKWLSHEGPLPLVDNTYVSAENFMPTRAHTLKFLDDPGGEGDARNVYFCPLSGVLVVSRGPVPPPIPGAAVPPAFESLVSSGRASRGEVPLAVAASGRLFYGYDAPSEYLPIVGTFARLTGTSPSSMWLLLDGETPSRAYWAIGVWAFALGLVLTAFIFLWRAVRALRDFRRSA